MISLAVALPLLYFIKCMDAQIVDVEIDFDKINTDDALVEYVSEILDRIKTFKVPVHPRISLFYQLLKKGMSLYADRTADTLFVPLKYNNIIDTKQKDEQRENKAEERKRQIDEESRKKREEQKRNEELETETEEEQNQKTKDGVETKEQSETKNKKEKKEEEEVKDNKNKS